MEDVNNRIFRTEIVDRYTIEKNSITASYTPAQQRFHQDLEGAVQKHFQYLQEVAYMHIKKPSKCFRAAKRTMDFLMGIGGLILLSPLFFVVAALIKIDSRGPVFINQKRVGKNGKIFRMHKFRTMVADAEKKTGPVWAVANDPRLTVIGRILRKSKMDELPQLVNLVKGEMSMVGPRPERPFFVDHFVNVVPGYARRLEVTPGITGIAQLRNGYDREAADIIKKLRYDITYIREMRLLSDLRILGETVLSFLIGKL